MGLHGGTGLDVPFGGHFAIVPAVDINLLPDMLITRPRLAQVARFKGGARRFLVLHTGRVARVPGTDGRAAADRAAFGWPRARRPRTQTRCGS